MKLSELSIRLASPAEIPLVIRFFEQNLLNDADLVCPPEYHCPLGVGAAIRRQQMMTGWSQSQLVTAVRFYPRKKVATVNLYQFAVAPEWRGQRLFLKLLVPWRQQGLTVASLAPLNAPSNSFFEHTGWQEVAQKDARFRLWQLPPLT